jgi:hypothetical protein
LPIETFAPSTYRAEAGQYIATNGARLTSEEAAKALRLKVREVSVFGQPPVPNADGRPHPLADYQPSKGVPPAFGERTATYADGAHFLYLFEVDADLAHFLRRGKNDLVKKSLVKIGYSKDPTRRLAQFNQAFPGSVAVIWSERLRSPAINDGATAKAIEDALKIAFKEDFEPLGKEFFLGVITQMEAKFIQLTHVARSPTDRGSSAR